MFGLVAKDVAILSDASSADFPQFWLNINLNEKESNAAKHFISSLLVVDQNARQTARSASGFVIWLLRTRNSTFRHPWLQMNTKENLPDLYRQGRVKFWAWQQVVTILSTRQKVTENLKNYNHFVNDK